MAPAKPAPTDGALVRGMDGFELLSAMPLFEELSHDEMQRVWDSCEPRAFGDGETILEAEMPATGLYIVRSGAVDVTLDGEILSRLTAGEFFGEMALIDEGERTSARIVAVGSVNVFFLSRDKFNRVLLGNQHTALKFYRVSVRTLCQRLRATNQALTRGKRDRSAAAPTGH